MSRSIVVIGGGCSGTLASLNLLETSCSSPLEIVLIEPRSEIGRGLAYSVPSDRCKLNVPVNVMGAFPDDPAGFFTWARSHDETINPDQFVSRQVYGSYLQALLHTKQNSADRNTIRVIRDVAVDLTFDETSHRFTVQLAEQPAINADACVLAVGNIQRTTLNGIPLSPNFRDPYNEKSYTDLSDKRRVLVIGTSLTAVDCILEAEGRGYTGTYVMLSRHARLPLPHEPANNLANLQVDALFTSPDRLRSMKLSAILKHFRKEATRIGSSQSIITSMRPHLQQIWKELPCAHKRRFLRHMRSFWDVHRHRIPQDHAAILATLRESGRLVLSAGRVRGVEKHEDSIEVSYLHNGESVHETFDVAFCCAGPESDVSKMEAPLIRNLLERTILRAGALGLGVDMTTSSLPLAGRQRFKILGPLQREELWETTAVREIRTEAAKIARELSALF